jgi:predicted acyltransferase
MSTIQTSPVPAQRSGSDVPKPYAGRLLSLDVFRGLAVAGMILVDNPGSDNLAYGPIQHTVWNGWTPADFIFPSFMFLVGASMVLSFQVRLQRGESRAKIFRHAVQRTLILIALGLFINGFPLFHLADWRIEGVLQRIAVCYLLAGILVLWSDWRGQLVALAACLLGYWALMRLVPVPGFGVPGRDIPFMDQNRNLVTWLDQKLFMGRLYNGTRDPEGLISNIPALGTMLLGVLTGHWLRSGRERTVVLFRMVLFGGVGVPAGLAWNVWFPMNKNLWTSSFVLFSAGLSLLTLALLYWILEIKQWRGAWTMPVLVFGMNAVAGFVADALVWGPGYSFTAKGPNGTAIPWHEVANSRLGALGLNPANTSLLYSLGALLFCWILLWLLWRKRIFLKV